MNAKEKAAKEALARKAIIDQYGDKKGFHVTKKGAEDMDEAMLKARKERRLPRPSDFKRVKHNG
jgi:hypothetical protein